MVVEPQASLSLCFCFSSFCALSTECVQFSGRNMPRMSSGNGKRTQPNMRMKDSQALSPPPQHDELIKFICDSWNKVNQEYQRGNAQGIQTVSYHNESEPNPQLKDFVPFDLEAWWGKRMVQNITQNT